MVARPATWWVCSGVVLWLAAVSSAQQAGSIRGMVYDKDFDAPLPLAKVTIVETGESVKATEQGNYVFGEVAPGQYTLIFSKPGYTRQVRTDIVVNPGQLTDVDAHLGGEFTEMDEFIVQDLQIGGGTEADLLILRAEVPQLLDSISADLMSQAGAGDAAAALRLVAGATVQEGKFAVIRGLPDRYVNSQMNGVRLPTADPDKRAVHLDQFPSAVIQSIQVSKTFTPDQQGDASGGAVNVVLKGVPQQNIISIGGGTSINTQVSGSDFLTYKGGGVNFWARDEGQRALLPEQVVTNDAAVGPSTTNPPVNYDLDIALGGRHEFNTGWTLGGFVSTYYERDASYHNNGIDDSYWVIGAGQPISPQRSQQAGADDFITSLFDVTTATQQVQWGALTTLGIQSDNHDLTAVYMYTQVAEDEATIADETRGKLYYYPDYDVDDPNHPGNDAGRDTAPWNRRETLKYLERNTETVQFSGDHSFPLPGWGLGEFVKLQSLDMDWTFALSSASLFEPDKRQFGTVWYPEKKVFIPGFGFFGPNDEHRKLAPDANINFGNLQRTWKDITEESQQYTINFKIPFEQWSGDEGYVKVGLFHDQVDRKYDQESFGNFGTLDVPPIPQSYEAPFHERWSLVFPSEGHLLGPADLDVDYTGEQEISAWYWMMDLPLNNWLNLIGGVRYETTHLSIINDPEPGAFWFPAGALTETNLNPGDADVGIKETDILPSIGFVYSPFEQLTLRGSYSETIARQTFKELTPILQQEYLGGDVFIGNPHLQMSSLKNYDLRLDYEPYQGGLVSASYFFKDIRNPIEYVQRAATFTFTEPVNFPEGQLSGFEVEIRQNMGHFWPQLDGLSIGANATLIDSQVTLPRADSNDVGRELNAIGFPISQRDMVNAPEYLYNLYLRYEYEPTGTQLGLFYTVKGDTLVAGDGVARKTSYVPAVYAREYGTLNFSLSQMLGEHFKLKFSAKNLTDPQIQEVYRSPYIDGDVVKTSYTKGIDLSVSLSASFEF